jgi:hypothetical protein
MRRPAEIRLPQVGAFRSESLNAVRGRSLRRSAQQPRQPRAAIRPGSASVRSRKRLSTSVPCRVTAGDFALDHAMATCTAWPTTARLRSRAANQWP